MFTAAYGDTAGKIPYLSFHIKMLTTSIAPADDDSGGESDPEAERTHAEEEEDGDDDDEEEDIVSNYWGPTFLMTEHSLAAR